jgi:hypothetical protein
MGACLDCGSDPFLAQSWALLEAGPSRWESLSVPGVDGLLNLEIRDVQNCATRLLENE